MADGQGLAETSEDDLLVSDQSREPHAVDGDLFLDTGFTPGLLDLETESASTSPRARRVCGRGATPRSRRRGSVRPPVGRTASSAPPPWRSSEPRDRRTPRAALSFSISARSAALSPVVPTTTGTRCWRQVSTLSRTAPGVVKSTTTPMPPVSRAPSRVSKYPCAPGHSVSAEDTSEAKPGSTAPARTSASSPITASQVVRPIRPRAPATATRITSSIVYPPSSSPARQSSGTALANWLSSAPMPTTDSAAGQ